MPILARGAPCVTGSGHTWPCRHSHLQRRIDRNGGRRNRCSPLRAVAAPCWNMVHRGSLTYLRGTTVLEKDWERRLPDGMSLRFQEAASIIGLAQQLLTVDQSYFQEVLTSYGPASIKYSSVSHLWVGRIRRVVGTGQDPLARSSGRPRTDQTGLSSDPGR